MLSAAHCVSTLRGTLDRTEMTCKQKGVYSNPILSPSSAHLSAGGLLIAVQRGSSSFFRSETRKLTGLILSLVQVSSFGPSFLSGYVSNFQMDSGEFR